MNNSRNSDCETPGSLRIRAGNGSIHEQYRKWNSRRVASQRDDSKCQNKVRIPDTGLYRNCRQKDHAVCAKCARDFKLDVARIAKRGFDPELRTVSRVIWATTTAPSFGAVHKIPAAGSRYDPRALTRVDQRLSQCVCGSIHGPSEDALRGVPLGGYDYGRQARWNAHSIRLVTRFLDNLKRDLDASRRVAPESFWCAQWQLRACIHHHHLLVLTPEQDEQLGLDDDELAEIVRRRIARTRVKDQLLQQSVNVETGELIEQPTFHSFGTSCDVRIRRVGKRNQSAGRALSRYVTSELTYSLKDFTHQRHTMRLGDPRLRKLSLQQFAHLELADEAARRQLDLNIVQRNNFGYGDGNKVGRKYSHSRGWSDLTLGILRQQRVDHAKERAHTEGNDQDNS